MEIKKHYYTIEEVMEMLDIGKYAVYNMLYTSEIPRISKVVIPRLNDLNSES